MDKSLLREKFKEIRKNDKNTDKPFLTLKNSEIYKSAKVIMCYSSILNEPEIPLYNIEKTVLLPITYKDQGVIKPAKLSDLTIGAYGIYEPKTREIYKGEIDLIIVPAICYNKKGYRVGYGKGYYDRFLRDKNAQTVGLCYESCITDIDFQDEFDIKVDYIATENAIYKTEREI